MPIGAIPPVGAPGVTGIGGVGGASAAGPAKGIAAPGFGDAMQRGLNQVSGLEQQADAIAQNIASGGSAQIHDLMIATTKAHLGVDLLVQVRNRAVEAYQEIMRLQV